MSAPKPGCPVEGCCRPTVRQRDGACEIHRKATAARQKRYRERKAAA